MEILELPTFEPPRKLLAEVERPAPYPLNCLGPLIGGAAEATFNSVQAPDGVCAHSYLAASALLTQAHRNISIDGREHPASLFLLSLAESGDRKTTADNMALKAVRAFEQKRNEELAADKQNFSTIRAIYNKKRDALLNGTDISDKVAVAKILADLGPEPMLPVPFMMLTKEPTYEGVVKFFERGCPSLGIFSSEGGRLLGGHGMNSDNRLKMVAGLSEFWDGDVIDRMRSGEGASVLFGKRLSIHLMFQLSVGGNLLGDPLCWDQGFISRCLMTMPASMIGRRVYRCPAEADLRRIEAFHSRANEILSSSFNEKSQSKLNLQFLRLTEEAKREWMSFERSNECDLQNGRKLAAIRGIGSKYPEQVLRLAAVIKFFHDPESMEIDNQTVEMAAAVINYYKDEALRIRSFYSSDLGRTDALDLMEWLRQAYKDNVICSQQMQQFGPSRLRRADRLSPAIKILEDHGYLIRASGAVVIGGVKRSRAWWINRLDQ